MRARCRLLFVLAAGALAVLLLAACASSPTSSTPARNNKKGGPLQHYQIARVHFESGKVQEALAEIDKSLRLDDSLPQVWFYRGYIYWTMSRWTDAESDFRHALELNEYFTDARMYLATTLEKQGQPDAALAELDRALQDSSFATPEKIYLTKARILRRQGRTQEALAALRAAVTVRPRFYEAHREMGQLFVELDRLGEAEAAFRTAEPGFVKDATFHVELGETLFKMQKTADATAEFRRAIELAPGSEAAAKADQMLAALR